MSVMFDDLEPQGIGIIPKTQADMPFCAGR